MLQVKTRDYLHAENNNYRETHLIRTNLDCFLPGMAKFRIVSNSERGKMKRKKRTKDKLKIMSSFS